MEAKLVTLIRWCAGIIGILILVTVYVGINNHFKIEAQERSFEAAHGKIIASGSAQYTIWERENIRYITIIFQGDRITGEANITVDDVDWKER